MRIPEKVLVAAIDDDRRVLVSLQELLESAGYDARLFGSAVEFLNSGEIANIACLVSDIRMPVMDGWQLEAAVAAVRPGLPIILITGDDVAQREARLREVGRLHRVLLTKPFDGQELLTEVRAAVRGAAP